MLMTSQKNGGRKGRIGHVVFSNDKMYFYAGVLHCSDCNMPQKILINRDDAETLGKLFFNKRSSFGVTLTKKLIKHYNL